MLMAGNNRKTQFLLKQAIHFQESCQLRMINLKIPRKANQMLRRAAKKMLKLRTYIINGPVIALVNNELYTVIIFLFLYICCWWFPLMFATIFMWSPRSQLCHIWKNAQKSRLNIHFHQICIKNKSRQSKNEKYPMYRKVVNTYSKITQWSS